jgi:hypothetical protein
MSYRDSNGELLHESGCKCERCRCLIAATLAVDSQGEYFFDDDEIQILAERES